MNETSEGVPASLMKLTTVHCERICFCESFSMGFVGVCLCVCALVYNIILMPPVFWVKQKERGDSKPFLSASSSSLLFDLPSNILYEV